MAYGRPRKGRKCKYCGDFIPGNLGNLMTHIRLNCATYKKIKQKEWQKIENSYANELPTKVKEDGNIGTAFVGDGFSLTANDQYRVSIEKSESSVHITLINKQSA